MAKKPTKAQKFYVEVHAGQKSPEELAGDTGLPVKVVNSILASKPKTMFGVKDGSVVMTQAQSEQDDETSQSGGGSEFFAKRVKNCTHKIDPDKPCR